MKASRAANKDQKNIDPQTRRVRGQALRAQIESVLTADQRTQLRTQLAREPRRAEKPDAPAAPPATR